MKLKEIMFVGEEDPEKGDTLEELKDNIKDALKCHFDKEEMPLFVYLHIVKEEKFACA